MKTLCEKNKKEILHIFIFFLISLIFTLVIALFEASRDDAIAHISRIYNLAQSFKNGNFDPYIYESCYLNLGYPYGIFYPDVFLKPFAFLVYCGMNEYLSYVLMIFTINFATMLITYSVMKTIKKEFAFIVTICYFIYPYRIFDLIWRSAVGELFFFAFLPIVILGIYKIFYENKFSWSLAIGLLCILNSHILSTALTLVFLLIFYIGNTHKIIKNPKILTWTIVNAGITILCSLNVVIPILEAQLTEQLVYNSNPAFFGTVSSHATSLISGNYGIYLSIFVILCLAISLFFIIKYKAKKMFVVWLMLSLIISTTNLFPWVLLEKILPFVSIIQFPSRLLAFAIIPYVLLICFVLNSKKSQKIILVSLYVFSILFSALFNSASQSVYNFDDVLYRGIGQGDYLSVEFDTFLEANEYNTSNSLNSINVQISTENVCYTSNGYVAKLFYKNYKIMDSDNKEYEYQNKNGLIFIPELEAENKEVVVTYVPTVYQNISKYLSYVSVIALCIVIIAQKRKQSIV